jgi:spore maturation protein CgeB
LKQTYDIVILGLSITSSWGNGHATTYRSLVRGLAGRGHRILFLERDAPWYASNRDEPNPAGACTQIYNSFAELTQHFEKAVAEAGLVMVGSFVPEGAKVGEWVNAIAKGVTAYYDIDTPVTLAKLAAGDDEYITPALIRRYHLYLSFTGGPTLREIERTYGSPGARVLYCSVDTAQYRPEPAAARWDLGYIGTYSDDRQPVLDALLLEAARRWPGGRFTVVGPMYPKNIVWPRNVDRKIHLSPRQHPCFYGAQHFTLNVTRAAMKRAGYSPSVRLFEAGACAAPIISDWWPGLDSVFVPGKEVLVARNADDTLRFLRDMTDAERLAIGEAARQRILAAHTPLHRAMQLEGYWKEANDNLPAHSSRRDGRRGQISDGLGARLAAQSNGQTAGGAAGAPPGAPAAPGDLHEPSGARS